jgi:hypothetical protein
MRRDRRPREHRLAGIGMPAVGPSDLSDRYVTARAALACVSMSELALMIFILPIAVSWWANWYPGAEPGGGSYLALRM